MSNNERQIALDQFRGYTVIGMLLVNFLQNFQWINNHSPFLQHYQSYFSYADAIMPQFFFAVGYSYRLTFLQYLKNWGWKAAGLKIIKRNFGLILLGCILYHLDGNFKTWQNLQNLGWTGFIQTAFQREPFQTLVQIGVTAIWVLPVIAFRWPIRLIYTLLSLLLFFILSQSFYYNWAMHRPVIDGGPLGFLSWTAAILIGAWTYDIIEEKKNPWFLPLSALLLLLTGYLLPQIYPTSNILNISQRAASISYQLVGAGFSIFIFIIFYWTYQIKKIESNILKTFGMNALAAYLLDGLVSEFILPWAPTDSPFPHILLMGTIHFILCYSFLRGMEKQNLFLRF